MQKDNFVPLREDAPTSAGSSKTQNLKPNRKMIVYGFSIALFSIILWEIAKFMLN
jgi:hypothetical protein